MQTNHNSRAHTIHIGDTPGVPGSGEEGILHYRTPKNLFLLRPPLPRAGEVANLPNM